MERFILDTNLFFNMEPGLGMGKKTEDVVVALTQSIKKFKETEKAEFFAPPKIIDEFLSFFEDKNQQFIKDFLSVITVKSPDMHKVQLPAIITSQLIDDVRNRNRRGQIIAEEEISKASREMMGAGNLERKDFEIKSGSYIKSFRERFRQATRFGFLDSVADLELIILAKELDGVLVSTDEGVIRWARVCGVKEMSAPVFGKKMSE